MMKIYQLADEPSHSQERLGWLVGWLVGWFLCKCVNSQGHHSSSFVGNVQSVS